MTPAAQILTRTPLGGVRVRIQASRCWARVGGGGVRDGGPPRAEATGLRWAKPTFVGWEPTVLVVCGQQAARGYGHVLERRRGHLPVMGGCHSDCPEHRHLSGSRYSAHEGGLCLA